MKIQYIVILMFTTLAALMVLIKFYRPREQKRMRLEAGYVEGVMKLKKDPENKDLREEVLARAREYVTCLGKDPVEAEAYLNRDLE